MKQATLTQRLELNMATRRQRLDIYVSAGFIQDEAAMMVKGSTSAQARKRQGGIWQVDNIQYPQAISAEHAEKLYMFTFGATAKAKFITVTSRTSGYTICE